jgi:hypothetical protein
VFETLPAGLTHPGVDPVNEQSSTPADKPKPIEVVIGIQTPQRVSLNLSVWARVLIRTSQIVSVVRQWII